MIGCVQHAVILRNLPVQCESAEPLQRNVERLVAEDRLAEHRLDAVIHRAADAAFGKREYTSVRKRQACAPTVFVIFEHATKRIGKKTDRQLEDIILYQFDEKGARAEVRAQTGTVDYDPATRVMEIRLAQVRLTEYDKDHPGDLEKARTLSADSYPVTLDLRQMLKKGRVNKKPASMTFPELLVGIRDVRQTFSLIRCHGAHGPGPIGSGDTAERVKRGIRTPGRKRENAADRGVICGILWCTGRRRLLLPWPGQQASQYRGALTLRPPRQMGCSSLRG